MQERRVSIRGEVITPADPCHDERRAVWNGMIDKRPALIVRCSGAADVLAAVQFARSQHLEHAVLGPRHCYRPRCVDNKRGRRPTVKSWARDPAGSCPRLPPRPCRSPPLYCEVVVQPAVIGALLGWTLAAIGAASM